MIVAPLEHHARTFAAEAVREAFAFVQSLGPEAEPTEHLLRERDLFVIVTGYDTRPPAEAVLETHRKYIDVQVMLAGREALEWYPAEGLEVRTPYDAEKDVAFYQRAEPGPARVVMRPGLFVALYPEDAHMPGLMVGGGPEPVKKAVIKIAVPLAE